MAMDQQVFSANFIQHLPIRDSNHNRSGIRVYGTGYSSRVSRHYIQYFCL